ncbi:hypothetical protein WA026_000481 [Henosepilachna vigintioctopunctata]|uniref:Uncharacterized protein n=1 Tax=Henosepilachna vigintioctopunctata TaxID=420089 RepID=A0AAW1UYL5_9CUCU
MRNGKCKREYERKLTYCKHSRQETLVYLGHMKRNAKYQFLQLIIQSKLQAKPIVLEHLELLCRRYKSSTFDRRPHERSRIVQSILQSIPVFNFFATNKVLWNH